MHLRALKSTNLLINCQTWSLLQFSTELTSQSNNAITICLTTFSFSFSSWFFFFFFYDFFPPLFFFFHGLNTVPSPSQVVPLGFPSAVLFVSVRPNLSSTPSPLTVAFFLGFARFFKSSFQKTRFASPRQSCHQTRLATFSTGLFAPRCCSPRLLRAPMCRHVACTPKLDVPCCSPMRPTCTPIGRSAPCRSPPWLFLVYMHQRVACSPILGFYLNFCCNFFFPVFLIVSRISLFYFVWETFYSRDFVMFLEQ
jgi:hypothetical protein